MWLSIDGQPRHAVTITWVLKEEPWKWPRDEGLRAHPAGSFNHGTFQAPRSAMTMPVVRMGGTRIMVSACLGQAASRFAVSARSWTITQSSPLEHGLGTIP